MSIFRVDFYSKDWLLKTQRLNLEERGAYIQIVAAIYEHQGPIDNDAQWLSNLCNCSVRKLKAVLASLFDKGFLIENDGKITQKRAEEELEKANQRRESASRSGRNNDENSPKNDRKQDENSLKTPRKPSENEEEFNKNKDLTLTRQQLTVNSQKKDPPISPQGDLKPPDVSEDVWRDFKKLRKKLRAEITKTAMKRITAEAGKAGWSVERALEECCARGWRGFKAEWVEKERQSVGVHWL